MVVQVNYELHYVAGVERYRRIADAIRAMCGNNCVHVPESTWYCSVPDSWMIGQIEVSLSDYISVDDRLTVLPVFGIAWRGLTQEAVSWLRAHLPPASLADILATMMPAIPQIPRPQLSIAELLAALAPPNAGR